MIIYVCLGDCGKTTEGMDEMRGEFKLSDDLLTTEWYCPNCWGLKIKEECVFNYCPCIGCSTKLPCMKGASWAGCPKGLCHLNSEKDWFACRRAI